MGRLFHDIEATITCVSGTGTYTFPIATRGTLKLCYVAPATGTTSWDVKLVDQKSRILQLYTGQTGTLRDTEQLPLLGVMTVLIENSTKDEDFDVLLRIEQET
jgi:hypothetical protein